MAKLNSKGEIITDATKELQTEVDNLSIYARQQGYTDIKEWVKEQLSSWSDFAILDSYYGKFLEAVDLKLPKSWDIGHWGQTSTFREFCAHSIKELRRRLSELPKEKDEKPLAFRGFLDQADEMTKGTGFTNPAPGLGNRADSSDYEFYEEIMRKTIETLQKFLDGKLEIWNNIEHEVIE